jgi:hypothetical protein
MDTLEFLKGYDIRVVGGGRGDHPSAAGGRQLTVAVHDDQTQGKIIQVRSGAHEAHRLMPLDESQAEAMVAPPFLGGASHHHTEVARRMLAHLLVKVSHMCVDSGIERCELDVSLHENEYHVLKADITSPHALHVTKRVVHDRRSEGYRPSGKQ